MDHSRGTKSFWLNGLANNLDGSEDAQLRREVKVFWEELGVPRLREQARVAVEVFLGEHPEASREDVWQLVGSVEDLGIEQEGQEAARIRGGEPEWSQSVQPNLANLVMLESRVETQSPTFVEAHRPAQCVPLL